MRGTPAEAQRVRRLRADPTTARIPLVVFTAFDVHQRVLATRGAELGIDDRLRKPFRSADLMACVHEVLQDARNPGEATA